MIKIVRLFQGLIPNNESNVRLIVIDNKSIYIVHRIKEIK